MPFTVSHIVAAVPFNKGLSENSKISKYTALSPLIIGSMTPDIAYLTPFLVHQRVDSHTLLGIYLFCIPMGLTIYFLYHLLMAPVIVSFFPKTLQQRLHPGLFIGKLPTTPSHVLLFSLILGALTHICWDFFTHQTGIPQYIAWMDIPLARIDGYNIMPYRVIQHLSSLIGLGVLFYWLLRWYKNSKPQQQEYWQAPLSLKVFSFVLLMSVSLVAGMVFAYMHAPETNVLFGLYSAQIFIKAAIIGGSASFLLCCFVLGLLYQYKINTR